MKQPLLIRIAVALFGVLIAGAAMYCLLGITRPFRAQTVTDGEVVGMVIERMPNGGSVTVFTIRYETDEGVFTDTVRGANNLFSPFEPFEVRYFNDDKSLNTSFIQGIIAFALLMPIGVATFLVALFAMGKKCGKDENVGDSDGGGAERGIDN